MLMSAPIPKTAAERSDKDALAASAASTRTFICLPNEPFSFRLPKTGEKDPWFGQARTAWNQLVLPSKANKGKPPVRSVVQRQPGAKRGVRLIVFASARRYFETLAKAQAEENQVG